MNARARILHVVENLDDTYGGPARSVPNLAAGCHTLGWNVTLHSVEWHSQEQNDVVRRESLNWHRHRLVGPRKLCLSGDLFRSLRVDVSRRPTIIHLHTLWNGAALAALGAARASESPLIISPRGALYPWSLMQGRFRKKLAWLLFVRGMLDQAALVHVTEPNEAEVVRRLGVNTPLVVVPNGVEQVARTTLSAYQEARRHRSEDPRKYLFLSRIHKKKGLNILLEAWADSEALARGGELHVVGPFATPSYQREIEAQVVALGVRGSVRFLGMLRAGEREAAYRSADVFVLPSHTENFGVAIVEAMARGLPVITTTGTPWAAIAQRSAGWWLDLSVNNLRGALNEAAHTPSERLVAMGDRAALLAAEFAWDRQCQRMCAAYESVLERRQ